jgi:hypothetical protein
MKYLVKIVLVCSMVFTFGYTFGYKPNDNQLHCKVCDKSYFVPSKRITKFGIENGETVLKTASFYKCAHCGFLSDVKVNDK